MKSVRKPWRRIVAVNLAILLVGLIGIELGFGYWVRPNNLKRLSIVTSQSLHLQIKDLYPDDDDTITYTRDAYGLRGFFDDPAEIDVLTVGGSTTDQRYITDGKTWQDILEQRFQADGRRVVVANAGLDGQSTYGHIKNFDWWFPNIPGLQPHTVLFYIGINDFYKDPGHGYDRVVQTKRTLRQIFRENSIIYQVLRTLKGIYEAEVKNQIGHYRIDFAQQAMTTQPLQQDYDALMTERLRAYGERLTVLLQRAREMGAEPIVVTQPFHKYRLRNGRIKAHSMEIDYDGHAVNGVDRYAMMRKLDAVTLRVCESNNVRCIDLAGEDLWDDNDYYDYTHMTPSGAKKVGDYLYEHLKTVIE
ncbi:MAG: SGNH/GDSL hydrolase family protein [Verrucomicrobia bacterium]|nr:SGNH/GDSL hydrolase family protein [Verrucomicrobiota bacterium]